MEKPEIERIVGDMTVEQLALLVQVQNNPGLIASVLATAYDELTGRSEWDDDESWYAGMDSVGKLEDTMNGRDPLVFIF